MMEMRVTDPRSDHNAACPLDAALAFPALLWLAAAGTILIATLAGYGALAAPPDLTLSEAAAIRDVTEVLRQIRTGAKPDAPARIRRGILREEEYLMTPLEAATVAGDVEVVRLLVQNGARLDESNVPVLFCLAQDNDADDIVSFLNENASSSTVSECAGVRVPQ